MGQAATTTTTTTATTASTITTSRFLFVFVKHVLCFVRKFCVFVSLKFVRFRRDARRHNTRLPKHGSAFTAYYIVKQIVVSKMQVTAMSKSGNSFLIYEFL